MILSQIICCKGLVQPTIAHVLQFMVWYTQLITSLNWSHESESSCISALEVSILTLSAIFIFDVGIVPTVWYCFCVFHFTLTRMNILVCLKFTSSNNENVDIECIAHDLFLEDAVLFGITFIAYAQCQNIKKANILKVVGYK
jgi:hypothetical protein